MNNDLHAYSRMLKGALLLTALTLSGCMGGPGPARYYLVSTDAPTPEANADSAVAIQIIDLVVPQYLDRLYVVKRDADNRLSFSEAHQWGENLRKNLLRNLALNLSASLNTVHVGTPLVRTARQPDYNLLLVLTQFELSPANEVVLSARWQLSRAADASPVISRSLRLTQPAAADDYDALVAVMSRVFSQLCVQIAATVPQPVSQSADHGHASAQSTR